MCLAKVFRGLLSRLRVRNLSARRIGISILQEGLLLGLTFLKGGIMYSFSFKVLALIFGPIWLASFGLAWRFKIVPYMAKFPLPPR